MDEIITVEDFLNWASDYFSQNNVYFGHGTDNPWDEAVMLVLHVLQLPAENDSSVLEQKLTTEQKQTLIELSKRRVNDRMPVPYLTHEAWFSGERYYVDSNVLIPRSPLAEIIQNDFQPWLGDLEPHRILDLCTGSGALAICCAKQFPDAVVDAVDISDKALEVANKNIIMHECVGRVRAIQSDLFTALKGGRYDIIISNPPYVGAEEMATLPAEYLHEPKLALESGMDGLELTIKILQQAKDYLNDDGLLIVEVGNSWHPLQEKYPHIPFVWLEFEFGGEGVFLLTAKDLREIKI